MGNDLSVVNAARVSLRKESMGEPRTWSERLLASILRVYPIRVVFPYRPRYGEPTDADKGLIRYLLKNRHGTPFEMVQLQFRIQCPIFEAREWFRHRIGSFNERSGRYSEFEPDFYLPEHLRKQVGKPGHYTFEPFFPPNEKDLLDQIQASYNRSYKTYSDLLVQGVAKEQARIVLPAALMTEFIWSINLRSLMNFISLRTSDQAMKEIREDALEVERLAFTIAPVSMKAFVDSGKVAP